jgi:hypothetical protein
MSQLIFVQGVFLSQAIKVNLMLAFINIFPVDVAVRSHTFFCQSIQLIVDRVSVLRVYILCGRGGGGWGSLSRILFSPKERSRQQQLAQFNVVALIFRGIGGVWVGRRGRKEI